MESAHLNATQTNSGLNFSNGSEIWQVPRQSDTTIATSNIAASRLHEIWR